MSELTVLTAQRDELLAKIKKIEETVEKTGIDRILEAIKKQRWYFFKNKPKVLIDRNTGLLWANLDYFPWCKDGNPDIGYDLTTAQNIVDSFNSGDIKCWAIPFFNEFHEMITDKSFPYRSRNSYYLKGQRYWYCHAHDANNANIIDLGNLSMLTNSKNSITDGNTGYSSKLSASMSLGYNTITSNLKLPKVIPCSTYLINGSDYAKNVSPDNHVYTEKERLQFTLELFVNNELLPIFDNEEITQLYKKIYFEKSALSKQLQELQSRIDALLEQKMSYNFNYTTLLEKYDINAINGSIIKYYQAVQQWCVELMDKLDDYEQETESVIRDFNMISLKLSKKYENNPHLTDAENTLLADRQSYFQKKFSLGMHSVKSKILAVKKQADDMENRIDDIDNGDNAIYELALLEKEERAGFELIAENTAKIIRNALLKIEYFQNNHQFVMNAVDIWENWSEHYRIFKTTYREDMKASCEEDGIEEEIWMKWYENWQNIRFAIEEKIQPVIERGLKSPIPTAAETRAGVPELLIAALDEYKCKIDQFFLEDRKGIYQKFVFQTGGELQDKFETESELYKCTVSLQTALQEIIFNCVNAEDRVFILKWANSLLDIQIDEILDFVADNDLSQISQDILSEFAALKQKNYDVYLADAKAYSEEKSRRDKEYNSLIFRMRKDLMKQ